LGPRLPQLLLLRCGNTRFVESFDDHAHAFAFHLRNGAIELDRPTVHEPCLRGGHGPQFTRTAAEKAAGRVGVMSTNGKRRVTLDPNAPGLDEMTRLRREAFAEMQQMSTDEIFQLAVRAAIYTADGQLTEHYRDDAEPSASWPTD
jgi:hypothetical protein